MHRASIIFLLFSFLTVLQSVAAQQTFDDHFRGRKQGQGASATSQAAAQASASAGANGANSGNTNGNANNGNNNAATGGASGLSAQVVQKASQSDGNPTDGQAASATDDQNFINFCQGKTITNGQQIKGGSCNGIVMGEIPSTNNMISAIITNPKVGEVVPANQAFAVQVQVQNLEAGSFTNPDNTYYAAPQQLRNGNVIGHCHVVIQKLQSLNDQTPPDPTTFAFFKGINDDGNGQGGLQAQVPSGLPAGNYRVCTMMGTSNHQPPLMPVAQRGAQDDCTKFTVGAANNGNANNGNANNGNANNGNANNGSANSGSANGNTAVANNGNGQAAATTTSAAAQQTSAGANDGQRGGRDRQGRPGGTEAAASASNAASASAGGNQVQGAATTTAAASQQTGSGRGGRNQGQRFAARAAYVVRPDAPVPRFMAREFIV